MVAIYGKYPQKIAPAGQVDNVKVGQLAARHLLERGLTNLAYYGFDMLDSGNRERGFLQAIQEAGRPDVSVTTNARDLTLEQISQPAHILNWLKKLPKPAGVFVFSDHVAGNMWGVCNRSGISLPGKVAILGVDNTEMTQRFGIQILSSVDPDIPRLGYEAARILVELLQGHPPPQEPTLVASLGVVGRSSTDVLASTDPDLGAALEVIRNWSGNGLTVEKLAKKCLFSWRTLDRHFRRVLGRSPGEEIRRVRLERVRQLLVDSNLGLSEISARTGFEHQSHLSNCFRQQYGTTPSAYRQKFRIDPYRL